MTDTVHIDDLGAPVFAAPVVEMMGVVGALAGSLSLDVEALCAQAAADTGLEDFGDQRFREPLGVFTSALRTEARLSPMGRVSAYGQLLQFLKNRLLIEQAINDHPDITELAIDRPIFIAGLPRTG